MAHFAKLDSNNVVIAVHVVNNEVITVDNVESEQAGIEFLIELHKHPNWKQTSYNKTFRKNYAGIGYKYDSERNAFIPPKCHGEAVINEETCIWDCTNPQHIIEVTDGNS